MNREELMNILPHRDDMLLVDEAEVVEIYGGSRVKRLSRGRYKVRGDEFFLRGHFPDDPIVPGVILCEMLAQSTCVLLTREMDKAGGEKASLFTGIKEVKFKSPVRPGDTFESSCEIINQKPPFYFAKGEGYVNGKAAVKAEFSFALIDKSEG